MVRDIRIKEYIFSQFNADNVGSKLTAYTNHVLNGEILRIESLSNYTGSLIVQQSGTFAVTFLNGTTASGTSKVESYPFSNAVGSFVTNDIVTLMVSGLASGTGVIAGPFRLLYR